MLMELSSVNRAIVTQCTVLPTTKTCTVDQSCCLGFALWFYASNSVYVETDMTTQHSHNNPAITFLAAFTAYVSLL